MMPGSGYPHVDIASIGACKPDARCCLMQMTGPMCYTDKKQCAHKLKFKLFGKPVEVSEDVLDTTGIDPNTLPDWRL